MESHNYTFRSRAFQTSKQDRDRFGASSFPSPAEKQSTHVICTTANTSDRTMTSQTPFTSLEFPARIIQFGEHRGLQHLLSFVEIETAGIHNFLQKFSENYESSFTAGSLCISTYHISRKHYTTQFQTKLLKS